MYSDKEVAFELRAKETGNPFKSMNINTLNFAPDVPTMIPLTVFSEYYYLSNTGNGMKRKYSFCNRSTPTLFKILGNQETNKACLVRSDTIYTDTRYFALFHHQWLVCNAYDGIEISEPFRKLMNSNNPNKTSS